MVWLFVLMTAVAILTAGLLPFWASLGFSVTIAWCAWLLYSIFYRPDALSQEIRRQAPPESSGTRSKL